MLKLHSSKEFLPASTPHCQMLIPFWGNTSNLGKPPTFEQEGRRFLDLVDIEDADIAVLPFDGKYLLGKQVSEAHYRMAENFINRAKNEGLKTVVIVNHDSEDKISFDETIVIRTSLSKGTRLSNEFAMVAGHEDIVKTHLNGQVTYRQKGKNPTVGFCGRARLRDRKDRRTYRTIKSFLQKRLGPYFGSHLGRNDGLFLRESAMSILDKSPRVNTNFLVRDRYFSPLAPKEETIQMRAEYINNILESDYVLCVRGYGNFSFRFFETLSLGRIPLLVDTDCVLPYDFIHDYREFCLVVPRKHIGRIEESVIAYHNQLTPDAFFEKQRRCREFWVENLSFTGFFEKLYLHWATSF